MTTLFLRRATTFPPRLAKDDHHHQPKKKKKKKEASSSRRPRFVGKHQRGGGDKGNIVSGMMMKTKCGCNGAQSAVQTVEASASRVVGSTSVAVGLVFAVVASAWGLL